MYTEWMSLPNACRMIEIIAQTLSRFSFRRSSLAGGRFISRRTKNQFVTFPLLQKHFFEKASCLQDADFNSSYGTMSSKAIQSRAAVVWKGGDDIIVETVEVAAPADNEVRVKMSSVGICHSDIIVQEGKTVAKYPTVLGHEGAGIVESIGKDVTSVKPGDHIILVWNFRCGKCRGCNKPTSNVCDTIIRSLHSMAPDGKEYCRISKDGQRLTQSLGIGAFSEYTVLHEMAVMKIDSEVPLHKAALFGCCVPTGYGAAKYEANMTPGGSVAIWGLGAVGLCVALGSRGCKAKQIIGIDINSDKFEVGKKFGCTDFINPLDLKKPIKEVISEMTGGGADYVFVCVGKEEVMEEAFECCHQIGECIIIGVGENARPISVNPMAFLFGRTLKGTWGGGTKREEMSNLVDLHRQGMIPVDDLITDRIKLDQINEGFALLKKGKSIRTIVDL